MTAEQGRDLPEGWVDISSLCRKPIIYGILQPGPDQDSGVPYIRPSEIDDGQIDIESVRRTTAEIASRYARASLAEGDVLLSIVGTIGKVAVVPAELEGANITQSSVRISPDYTFAISEYVAWFLRSPLAVRQYNALRLGTGVPRLNVGDVRNVQIPLRSLAEQRRIVEKIEALTARSRRAREALEALPALLDRYRASVLAAAFRGDLTKDWREANPAHAAMTRNAPEISGPFVLPQGWRWTRLDAIAHVASNLVDPGDYPDSPHIAPNHIESKTGRLLDYATIAEDGVTSAKHRFFPGQVIYSKIRPYLAKAVVVDFEGLCSADAYPLTTDLDAGYLQKWLISDAFTEMAAQSQGRTVLPKINKAGLGKLPVPLCSDDEMRLIAQKVRAAFDNLERLSSVLGSATDRLSTLDQSILAKAFRGELVPQDPADEPASVLLERIRARRAAEEGGGKRGRRASRTAGASGHG